MHFHSMGLTARISDFLELHDASSMLSKAHILTKSFPPFAPRKYSQTLEVCLWQQSTNSERLAERSCFLRDNSLDLTRWSETTAIDTFLYLH